MECCDRCSKHNNCVRQWIFKEKNVKETCCQECDNFMECLTINRGKRWEIIHDFEGSTSEEFVSG